MATVGINNGAKGYFGLMQHDYVELPFSLREPVLFGIGSYIDLRGVFDDALGGKLAKVYCVTDIQTPTYNTATGGYDYRLRLSAYYWLWNNFIFRYTPEAAGGEASWSLTGNLKMQTGVFLRNLAALGFTYKGLPYECDIDNTVADKAVAMTYDNTRLLDALFSMGSDGNWDCDVWITDNVIHFGRNVSGDAVKIEIGIEAADMARSESKGTYATRLYAFGSDRNLPENYRPVDESLLVNGVVQKRLMLPEDTPYIDAFPMQSQHEAVEQVVVFDDIYPRRTGHLQSVRTVPRKYDDADTDEETGDGGEQQKPTTYDAYQYRDTGLEFKEEYKLPGKELRIVFQSGHLNGMDFGVVFEPGDPADAGKGSGVWEIVANEDYGRLLPDETLKPMEGDEYILYGFDIRLVSDQYLAEAEQELLERATRYMEKAKVDDGTYTVPLYSHWVKADQIHRTFDAGQRIQLVNPGFFPDGGRTSRVIGWEMCLDIPYDTPTYTIGESARYSRIGDIEGKVETLTYKGAEYQGSGGRGVYLIRVNDSTPASDSNVYSALRSLATFLRKDKADSTKYLLSMLGGAIFGKEGFSSGLAGFGAKIDDGGNGEMESLTLRRFLETPELRYNRVSITVGDKWRAPGLGIIEAVEVDTSDSEDGAAILSDTGTVTLHLEDGEIGAVDVGDICMGIFHDWTAPGNNAADDFDDGMGNREYAGFCTVYFTVTEILDSSANRKFRYRLRETSQSWTKQYHPCAQMHFVAYGNFTNTARQSSVYETRTYTRMLVGQDTWEIGKNNIALQWGNLSNLSALGLDMTGYSAYLNNIYMSGTIQQTGPDTNPCRMEAEISDGDIYFHGPQSKTVTCRVLQGWEDRTEEAAAWKITRHTGDTEADALWNAGSKAASFDGTVQLDAADLGTAGEDGAEFVMSATMPGTGLVETALTLRVMPVAATAWWLAAPGGNLLKPSDFTEADEEGRKYAPVAVDVYSQTGTTVTKYGDGTPLPDGMLLTCRIGTESSGDYQEVQWPPGQAFPYLESYSDGKATFRLMNDGQTINTLTVTVVVDGEPGVDAVRHWIVASPSSLKKKGNAMADTVSVTRYTQVGDGQAQAEAWGGVRYRFSRGSSATPWLWLAQDAAQGTVQVSQPSTYDSLQIQLTDEHDGGNVVQEVDVPIVADGEDGTAGCILRTSEWNTGVEYRNDEGLAASGPRFLDIAVITHSATAFSAYKCKLTHTANSTNRPGDGSQWTTYWEEFNVMAPIYTPLILAQNALLRFTQTNRLLVMKGDGTTVAAGMGGGDFPIWAGAPEAGDAPFRVGIDGKLYSTNAEIAGNIIADGGRFLGGMGNPYTDFDLQGTVKFPSLRELIDGRNIRVVGSTANGAGIMLPVSIGTEQRYDGVEFIIRNDTDDFLVSHPGNLVPRIRMNGLSMASVRLKQNTSVRFKIFTDGSIADGGLCYEITNPSGFYIMPSGILENGEVRNFAVSKNTKYYPANQSLQVVFNAWDAGNNAQATFYADSNYDETDTWGPFYLSKAVWYNNYMNTYNTNIPCHNYWFGLEDGKMRELPGFDVKFVNIRYNGVLSFHEQPKIVLNMYRGQRLFLMVSNPESDVGGLVMAGGDTGSGISVKTGKLYEFVYYNGLHCLNPD